LKDISSGDKMYCVSSLFYLSSSSSCQSYAK